MGRARSWGGNLNAIEVVAGYLRARIPESEVAPLHDIFTFRRETLGFEVFHGSDVAVLEVALELLEDHVLADLGERLDGLDVVGLLAANPSKTVVVTSEGVLVRQHSA